MLRPLYIFIYKIIGWKVVGNLPTDRKKYIIAVAPHTSGWDFVIGIMARSILKIQKGHFLGKSPLFKPPFGWFFRWMGGHPVDRSKHNDLVQQVVDIFNAHDEFILAIAPEGTRKKVEKLKTGFYYIAKEANIPIVPVGFDFAKKQVVIGAPFYPGPSFEDDMNQLLNFYKNITGANPELGL